MADTVKVATRDSYGKALVELGAVNDKLIVLDADLAAATKTGGFKKAYPDRFFDTGIAESNMMCIAGGLSTMGYTVFASTFAMFAAGRAFEQVRNTIGYPHLNVKIGATHAGISVGEDGASHQCCEDIALMRTIPGMTIINPADDTEARQAVFAAAQTDGPVYMRFGRLAVPVIFGSDYKFEIGKGVKLTEGTDVTIIATGLMVGEALTAAELLKAEGISASVINMATIKPIDRDIIIEAAKTTGAIVTAEEHNIIGGLGGAVAEVVCETVPVPVVRLGVEDTFGRSGPATELLHLFGLDAANIVAKAKAAIAMKK
ncbi:MAG: transketolase family protein [Clostridia bacterium]|nr:transketolase family protein [Clostridia bacterium]